MHGPTTLHVAVPVDTALTGNASLLDVVAIALVTTPAATVGSCM